jgi:hypothetical protein
MAVRGNYKTRSGPGGSSIEMTGPLFMPNADMTLRQNIRRMLQALADEGVRMARANVSGHRRTGDFEGGIEGRVRSLKGAPWWLTAVVSQTHIEPWAVRGSRSFGVAQSGVRRQRGSRKSAPVMHAWSMSDTQVMERMANANYRGGKLERKTHAFRNAASQMKSSRAVLAANLTAGLE